jgi:hypothetical protein
MTIEAPIVNLNGTSPDSLIEAYIEACHALRVAAVALADTAPNGRDWQTSRDRDAFKRAQAQHAVRMQALNGILADVVNLVAAVDDQR